MERKAILIDGMEVVTIRVASKMLGKSIRTVRHWIHTRKIKAIKDDSGYRWLIFVDNIRDLMEAKHADKD